MHELTVTKSILETCIKHAKAADAKKIISIKIVIGQFASIIDDSIMFYWNLLSDETFAKGSILEFERIPAIFCCQECKNTFEWNEEIFVCPYCSSNKITLQTGTEFYIQSIEVE